ncbi:MAG: hypothetical protein SGJ27_24240 [Candidatus Melainabacteria bacterium]|nr:hypothetical protein [Candidatus Melainabacteria bacterium]
MRLHLLAASLCLLSVATAGPALCVDDPGIFGSIEVAGAARKAARAMKSGSYGEAQSQYRNLILKDDEFCFGFYESSRKLNHWDQAALALEQLFEKKPVFRDKLNLEYGEVLFNLNRYDEAEPLLKLALAKVNEPSIVSTKLKTLYAKSDPPELPPVKGQVIIAEKPAPYVVPSRAVVDAENVNENTEEALSFTNAFLKSESIVLAEYKGYEAGDHVGYFDPPTAQYKIETYLKGPPLNKALPLRYEFRRNLAGEVRPADWKWSPALMPAKGSKWIIFIPNAVPVAGRFETFHGAYGRQELTDDNLDAIHKIRSAHQGQTN